MAGEAQENPITYNDISSGKVVNKEGLLELSVKIKEYVAENAGGSSGGGRIIEDITISSPINSTSPYVILNNTNFQNAVENWFNSYLDSDKNVKPELYNVMGRVKLSLTLDCFITVYPIHKESNPNANYNKHWLKYEIFNTNGNWDNNVPIISYGTMWKVGTNWLYQIQSHSTGQNYILPTINTGSASAYDVVSKYILKRSITGKGSQPAIVEDTWINETDLATELNIPSIPASSSTDGTYMLVDTVSNGTSTKSWETVPSGGTSLPTDPSNDGSYVLQNTISSGTSTLSWTTPSSGGGGTTYTAGTGISITNGVISLDLANASEEAM